jgi:hypothetical protein
MILCVNALLTTKEPHAGRPLKHVCLEKNWIL